MTGRELIIYIMENHLEDEPVFKDGKFIGFVTTGEAAVKCNVGIATIHTWITQNKIDGVFVNEGLYIPGNFKTNSK